MRFTRLHAVLLAFSWLISFPAHAKEVRVVASIAPLHSLVSGIMEGVEQPQLLVEANASAHTYSLKPSDLRALHDAQVVFYIGDSYEFFLEKSLKNLPKDVQVVNLSAQTGITLYSTRTQTGEEAEDHHEGPVDMHIWLDVNNARRMAEVIAHTLSTRYPHHQKQLLANLWKTQKELRTLDANLRKKLRQTKIQPFAVFHDAYQYFEKSYRLPAALSITLHPDQPPSARQVALIRDAIKGQRISCIFHEPQFDPKLADSLAEGTEIYKGTLDPLGAGLQSGAGLYKQVMQNLAEALLHCVK